MDKKLEESSTVHKPAHCLILPYPLQGHINPMLQFSKRLAHKGIKITLAATKRLLKTTPHDQFSGPISVETISDGFDDGFTSDGGASIPEYMATFKRVGPVSLAELLEELGNSGRSVDCVIYDPFLPWGLDVAKKFCLIAAGFFTQSSCVNSIYYHVHKGRLKVPLLKKDQFMVPGLEVAMEISDMPSFLQDQESHTGAFDLLVDQFRNVEEADFVLVNSIYELEEKVTDWMAKFLPVKTIGPTIPSMYLDKRLLEDKEYSLNMFKPVNDCMKWLDERSSKSVIYVSFGSMAKLDDEQMEELALGLKMTNKYFLWVVRSSEESKLPENFAQETSEKGLIVSWSPQLDVLSHDAVGCFLTHCGWNSTLEALSLGVPMIGAPWWSDQPTNAKLLMDVWKMGIRACSDEKNILRNEEIVRCVKHVIDGEEMQKNAKKKWKEMARKAVDKGGSSDRNIEEFVSTLGTLPPK